MMDEIEFQLCLSIDPNPFPTPANESEKQKEKQKRSSVRGQSQQLQILGVKRLAEKMGYNGDDDNAGAMERSLTPDNSLKSRDGDGDGDGLTSGLGSGEGDDHLSYLQLPPRKKVQTSFAWDLESTWQAISGGGASAEFDMDTDKDQESNHTTQTTDAFNPIPSCLPLDHSQLPFTEEPGEYMPALINSLQLLSHPHPHPDPPEPPRRFQRFEIYEDPDDMDIDGVGYFNVDINTAWYLSPDENKENAEEDGNGNHQHYHGHLSQPQSQRHRQVR